MRRFVARMLNGWRRDRCADRAPSPRKAPESSRETARALAQTLDRTMQLNQWEQAQRIAATASRIEGGAHEHAVLAERIARLNIARGAREQALAIIDACRENSASLRLLRNACLISLGRRREAHLDLHEWSRRASAPLQARVLLALLNWRLGDHEGAIAALVRNVRQIEDPNALEALTLLCAEQGRHEQSAFWAQRLFEIVAPGPQSLRMSAMLQSLGSMNAGSVLPDLSPAQIESLKVEIVAYEQALPALVAAQQIDTNTAAARLLMRGIEAALDDLDDRAGACELLSSLARCLNDSAAAFAWSGRAAHELRRARLQPKASVAEVKQATEPKRDVLASIHTEEQPATGSAVESAA